MSASLHSVSSASEGGFTPMMNLIVGKFYPPHLGHHHLIDEALKTGPTIVLILWSEQESIPVHKRGQWLRECHPDAVIIGAHDEHEVDYNSDQAWDQHISVMRKALRPYDLGDIARVYGAEPYISRLAAYFDADPMVLDRQQIPVSGTAVRADVRSHWQHLAPPVRAGLCKRVVCIGAESCGTTTLARDLAQAYDTVWVPEYGRTYSEGIGDKSWTHDDLMHIASSQRSLEDSLAYHAENGVLVCDTNTLATRIWENYLVGPSSIKPDPADLFILTDICPWEDDGLRQGESFRLDMQNAFKAYLRLNEHRSPWIEVTGKPQERVAQACATIDKLTWDFTDPKG